MSKDLRPRKLIETHTRSTVWLNFVMFIVVYFRTISTHNDQCQKKNLRVKCMYCLLFYAQFCFFSSKLSDNTFEKLLQLHELIDDFLLILFLHVLVLPVISKVIRILVVLSCSSSVSPACQHRRCEFESRPWKVCPTPNEVLGFPISFKKSLFDLIEKLYKFVVRNC